MLTGLEQQQQQQQQPEPPSAALSFRWQRDSGSPRSATAHSLSTPILLGGLLQQLSFHSTLTLLYHSTSCSTLHQYCTSALLFLLAQPSLSLCVLHMFAKNNSDFSCSRSFYASDDNSLELNPLGCASCGNHMFNGYIS